MTGSLAGKVVFVAGASSGMGRAIAHKSAAAGATLIVHGRNAERLEQVAGEIEALVATRPRLVISDATDAAQLDAALRPAEWAGIDILVNSVGVNIRDRSLARMSVDSWRHMIDANLNAAFNLVRLALPGMRQRQRGLVINIASTAARRPDMSGAAYQASKAGVLAFTQAIAIEESANGIRATTLLPGMTNTPLLDNRPAPLTERERQAALQPDNIADACLFVMQSPSTVHIADMTILPFGT
jgi:NADP-dependent 3-hydroxy acid dehydrogenase YdfG